MRLLDFAGEITLNKLIEIIGNAELLISNETVAPHIAVAVNCQFICISNGNHYGRFHPYPEEIFNGGYYVYPPQIMKHINNSAFPIISISLLRVISPVKSNNLTEFTLSEIYFVNDLSPFAPQIIIL